MGDQSNQGWVPYGQNLIRSQLLQAPLFRHLPKAPLWGAPQIVRLFRQGLWQSPFQLDKAHYFAAAECERELHHLDQWPRRRSDPLVSQKPRQKHFHFWNVQPAKDALGNRPYLALLPPVLTQPSPRPMPRSCSDLARSRQPNPIGLTLHLRGGVAGLAQGCVV